MKKDLAILSCAILYLLPYMVNGQGKDIPFQHISTGQGLSQGQVNCLLKDSDGFVWLGTQDGLNRYDGYRFRQFSHQTGDTASISNNYIWCLLEDSRGGIWAGTFGGGLCRFDRETETFRTFHPKPFSDATVAENSIRSLCESPKGTLWVGADRGLWKFDLLKQEFTAAAAYEKWQDLSLVIALQPLREGQLLAGAGTALLRLDIATGAPDTVDFKGQNIPGVSTITQGKGMGFWAGSGNGLHQFRYLPERDSLAGVRHFSHQPGNPKSLPGNFLNHLFLEKNGILWIGSNNGLSRFDTRDAGAGFANFAHDRSQPNSLSSNMVLSLCEIEPGLMWAGTREGINRFSNLPSPFYNFSFQENGNGLCVNDVLGMTEDGQQNLWVATRNGLTRIGNFSGSPEKWEAECLTPSNTPSMPFEYVIRVKQAAGKGLWVTFRRNGFALLRQDGRRKWFFEKPAGPNQALQSMGLNDLLEDKHGITWLGTPGKGLLKWDPSAGKVTTFATSKTDPKSLKHDYIFCLLEDSRGQLWIGAANGGLCRMNKAEGNFDCFTNNPDDTASLSSNMVLSIFEDSRQRLWACTANGLDLMENEGRFRRFYKKDGLPNDVVYGMAEDSTGHFWASTNRGISKITFRDGVFATQNFDLNDGLQGNEFNQHAFYKTRDGRLCFGGTGGLTVFDPAQIQPYPHMPNVALTDFQLFNQPVPIRGNTGAAFSLKKAINETEEIVLRHDQNFIAFEFAALGYTQPENNRYACKMEGLDQGWVFSGTRRFASYPNLAPGSYTFLVKAANHDGVWNGQPKSIRIRVLPPWWRSWWAYLFYILAVAAAVAAVIKQREASVRRLEKAKTEERERFRKRTARDFHDEAGNKITKIALLTEVAKRQAGHDATLPPLLSQIEENIQELRSGMRDFIWVLDPENDNLYDTLLRLKDFANGIFEHSSIHFTTEGLDESVRHTPLNGNQRRHLLLLFKEAINNCLKYSQATEAKLSLFQRDGAFHLAFSDNGLGFDPETVSQGNGLKNMRARAEKVGGGFGIVSSGSKGIPSEKAGTVVTLRLPVK